MYSILRKIAQTHGTTAIALNGFPSYMTSEFLIRDLAMTCRRYGWLYCLDSHYRRPPGLTYLVIFILSEISGIFAKLTHDAII